MEILIQLNPRHESFQITAFYDVLATSSHHVVLVFRETDLVDPTGDPSLENLGVGKHLLNTVHGVVYQGNDGSRVELYNREV